ncbi:hypothetical protein GC170_05230 [bacterium]|nr:hypothetical protein [bacterium]
MSHLRWVLVSLVASLALTSTMTDSPAQGFGRGPGPHGKGAGFGKGAGHHAADGPAQEKGGRPFGKMGGGPPGDQEFPADRADFQFLLANHEKIRRNVINLENGAETVTESDDPEVAAKIHAHARAMHKRVKLNRGIHKRDPLFAEIFRHADKIEMAVGKTPKGVKVLETSDDPYVAKLIQAHAAVVSKFVANGHLEVQENHSIPPREADSATESAPKNSEHHNSKAKETCSCEDKPSGTKACENCESARRDHESTEAKPRRDDRHEHGATEKRGSN